MKGLEAKTLGLRKVIRHEYKRIVAFMLTVAMVVTNFGTNLTVAFAAGEEESSLFLLNSSELEDAISTALESGDVFDFSSLELKAKQKSLKTSYEKLIGSKAGKVYQLDVDIDSSYATEHTDLQVFYNAGTDDVVFLFINESDMAVTFRANVSGYETARVTVNPNTTNIEDAEGVENAEDYSGTTMVDDEKKPQAEVVKPEGETSESESASDETEAAETEADVTESENASENGEAEETTGAEEAAETETTAAEETEAETEPETEAEAPAEETEAEIELTPEEGSASASISAKKVFRVSTSAEAAGEAPAADAEEETEAETETEAEEPEKETEAPAETTAEETVADDSTEETTAADETDGELTDETEAPTEDVTTPDETTGEQPADNGGSENIGFDSDEQFLEDDSIELAGELNGKAYNTVTIWGSANARAYVVKAEDLTGEAAVEGQYSVDYSVDPVGAATIKGAHTVNEGETLYFAVDPQVGYEITEVTVNGESLEEADAADVASASDLEQHEHVYAVEAVTEDLEIVASLEETVGVAHPEFNASYVSSEGVTISLHAEEGILPEGTELSVTEVTDALGDTIKEKMDSETEGTTVHSVLAYDINLLYNGKKLSNSWSESGYVDVTFTGAPIQEMTEASDKVEIVAVDDTSKTQLNAENAAEAEAGELKLETVSEQNVEDAAVEEVGFKAEHFTIYAVAASSGVMAASIKNYNITMKIGQTQTLRSDESGYYQSWSSSNTSALTVTGNGQAATVTAVGVGTATITYEYYDWGWKKDTATITVTADPITGVTLTGENEVKLFGQVQLNANLQPTTGSATLTWESSDEGILTVDETGMVTGRKLGTATITVWAVDHAGHRFSAAKEITVTQATTTENAQFYYLTTPTADPKSNNTSVWGRNIGTGKIVVTNGTWENNKNMLDNVSSRVVKWPNGTTGSSLEITQTGTYAADWNTIYEAYKTEIEREHGKIINKSDIESIKLKPYKISKDNNTNPDKHVDCTVEIKVKDVYTANYWLWNAGQTGYEYAEARSYYKNEQTSPTASRYPATKTVNGVTYTFLGWYDNEALSGEAVTFPYTITDHNVNFYAKYVAGYYVDYDLNGGTWGSAQTKWFKNVGSTVVVVATEPEKTGYDFTGWTYSEDGSRTYRAGDSFVMPEKNVKLTANWTPDYNQKKTINYTVRHTLDGVEQSQYTKTYSRDVWVLANTVFVTSDSIEKQVFVGYKYDSITPSGTVAGSEVEDGTIITLNYIRDDSQTQKTRYTVKHVVDGVEQKDDTKSYYGTAWINDQNPQIAIQEGSLAPKTYPGYKYASTSPNVAVGDQVANGSEITLTYVKDDEQTKTLTYTVKHTVEGVEQTDYTQSYTETVWVNAGNKLAVQKDSIAEKNFTGYKFDSITPNVKEGEKVASGTTIVLNYVKDDSQTQETKYVVKHVVDGEEKIDDRGTYTGTAWVNDVNPQITIKTGSLAPKTYPGYKYVSINPDVNDGDQVASGSEIVLTYVKDDEQTKTLKYTVKHTLEGAEQADYTKSYTATVWINDADTLSVTAESIAEKNFTGYKFASISPEGMTGGTVVENGAVIVLNYVKDDSQTQKTRYTVKHVVDGVEQTDDTKSYYGTAWINDQNPQIAIQEGSLAPKTYPGYKYASTSPNVAVGDQVANGSEITLTYVKDDEQTKTLTYTVKHTVEGVEQTDYTQSYTETVWVNAGNKLAVQKDSIAEKNFTGYKFDSITPNVKEGEKVASGTTIVLNYVKDDSQTQETKYVVKHVVDGEEKIDDRGTYTGTAWVNDVNPQITIKTGSLAPKTYPGYKYVSINPDVNDGDQVASGSEIVLTYVKDDEQTKTLKYTVKHTLEGAEQADYTKSYTATVWINDADTLSVTAESIAEKNFTGYKFASISPEGMTGGTVVENGAVIVLNYVKDDSQTQKTRYTVKHVVDGVEQTDDTKSYYGTAWINDQNPQIAIQEGSLAPKTYPGYKYASTSPNVAVGDQVANGSEITLTYVKDDEQTKTLTYTVKHTVEGVEQTDYTQSYTETVWVNAGNKLAVQKDSIAEKNFTGYKFDSITPNVKEGEKVASGTTIVLNYVKDDSQTQETKYVVKHVVDGEEKIDDRGTYTGTAWVNDVNPQITIKTGSLAPKTYPGYKYVSINPDVNDGDQVASGSEIVLTYVKDDEQTKTLKYTVKHTLEGAEQADYTKSYTATVWINDADTLSVTAESIAEKNFTGYKFASISPEGMTGGTVVENGAVIVLNYVKDDSQTQKTRYTVKHVVDGVEQTDDTKSYYGTAWINDQNPQIAIQEGSLAPKTYPGYKYASTNPNVAVGDQVANGSEITLTYVKDDEQTKTLTYTVEHTVEGVEQTDYTQSYTETVWVNAGNDLAVQAGSLAEKSFTGYKLDSITPNVKEGEKVASGTMIVLNYVKDDSQTQETKYVVKHVVDGVEKIDDRGTYTGTAWINETNPTIEVKADSLAQKVYEGYRFESMDPSDVREGELVANGTIITLNYVRDNFVYRVTYHYEDAKGNEIATVTADPLPTAEYEAKISYTDDTQVVYQNENYTLERIITGNNDGADGAPIVTADESKNYVDIYYALDEIGELDPEKPDGIPDKYQLVFTYVAEDHGTVTGIVKEVVTRYEGDKVLSTTAPAYPRAEVIATPDNGYNFVNWTSDNPSEASKNIVSVLSRVLQRSSATNAEFADVDAIRSAGFAKNTEFTAHFIASDATTYKVEVYYEHEGKYSTVPSKTETLAGTTDTKATVAAETYLPTSGYVFDQNAGNVLEGTIAGDNSLVLKVYYKQVFKVTYAPGDHGSFKSQTYTVSYGDQTPEFSGDKTVNGNYRFTGWDKTIESQVTADVVYTALWTYSGGGNGGGGGGSSSGGGGGSSSGPRDNGSTPSGGPGTTTVTIDPDAVPLANLPNEDGADNLLMIDDEDVPLAALPKTGQSGTNGLVFFLSSMMLAAFVAVTKKREDDK